MEKRQLTAERAILAHSNMIVQVNAGLIQMANHTALTTRNLDIRSKIYQLQKEYEDSILSGKQMAPERFKLLESLIISCSHWGSPSNHTKAPKGLIFILPHMAVPVAPLMDASQWSSAPTLVITLLLLASLPGVSAMQQTPPAHTQGASLLLGAFFNA